MSDVTKLRGSPAEAHTPTLGGRPQRPNTAEGGRTYKRNRVLTVRLDPESDQWHRLHELAYQAAQYKNHHIRAKWAEAIGLRVDPDKGDPHDLTKHVRRTEKGELSGAAYSAAERDVAGAWTRDGKRILAGLPMPQYRIADSLAIRGHKNRKESGVRLTAIAGGYVAELQVQNKDCEGGSWIVVPLHKGNEKDYQIEIIERMARWDIPIAKGALVFKRRAGKLLLQLSYALEGELPPMGEREALLTPRGTRLLLLSETQTVDYTARLTTFQARKTHWDGIRRRVLCQIGKRNGHARAKRRKLGEHNFGDWSQSFLHEWSAQIIDWCRGQGVGSLRVVGLTGGDWPADRFVQYLSYKGQDANIVVTEEASLEGEASKRAVTNAAKKAQHKAKKLGDAAREIEHQLGA